MAVRRFSAITFVLALFPIFSSTGLVVAEEIPSLGWVRPSADGTRFILDGSREPIVFWGVNYDHDGDGRLLEDYWRQQWSTVVEDFREIKSLRANVVRIHLQVASFLDGADKPNQSSLEQLGKLVKLAEQTGLYLDITGLGCYHKQDVPPWYDQLDESARWKAQACFWRAVAETCRESPAIFCYDLMNEPILPGKEPETEWVTGELDGKFFVQRLSLNLAGRTREEVATQWVSQMTSAIRQVDLRHMITVGVIPWALVFKGAKPLFYSPDVGKPLDFVSVHFYPRKGEVEDALTALRTYDVGKPLVVEEMFPLHCSLDELETFVEGSRPMVDGWMSFYWGRTIEESEQRGDLVDALIAQWLKRFRSLSPLP